MGKMKYRKEVMEFIQKTPTVSVDSLRRMVGRSVHILVHFLIKRGHLFRITKGCYSRRDDPCLAVFCFRPAYIALQNALSVHNLWEQETNTIILTTKTIREGRREIFGNNVFLYRLPPKQYFGVEHLQYGETYVPVSDVEKTLLDLVFFEQPLDRDVLAEIKKRINRKKLNQYLYRYDKAFCERFWNTVQWTQQKPFKSA